MFIKIAEACVPHQNVIIRPKDKPWMNSDMYSENVLTTAANYFTNLNAVT